MKAEYELKLHAFVAANEAALHVLEKRRLMNNDATAKRRTYYLLAGLVWALFGFIAISITGEVLGFIVSLILLAVSCVGIFYIMRNPYDLNGDYADQVSMQALKDLDPSFYFSRYNCLSEQDYLNAEIYSKHYDRYSGSRLMEGTHGQTQFRFSHLHVEEKYQSTDSKGNRTTHWVDIFNGVLFIADFNKHFSYDLTVLPDIAEKHFGWLGRKMQSVDSRVMQLENPEFEKQFKASCKDSVTGHYILTPDMQERMLHVLSKCDNGVAFAFRESKVYIAIPKFEPNSDPNHDVSFLTVGQLKYATKDLLALIELIDDLDLNNRIWTKE